MRINKRGLIGVVAVLVCCLVTVFIIDHRYSFEKKGRKYSSRKLSAYVISFWIVRSLNGSALVCVMQSHGARTRPASYPTLLNEMHSSFGFRNTAIDSIICSGIFFPPSLLTQKGGRGCTYGPAIILMRMASMTKV